MYEEHFGLTGRPFGETVGLNAYLALTSREAVLRRLRFGLEHNGGPALLFGPPGAGKTLLALALADTMGSPLAHLTFPKMPVADLLSTLCDQFDVGKLTPGEPSTIGSSFRRLRNWLAETNAQASRPLLIVDEAQLIHDPDTFEVIRILLNFASLGPPDLSLLLVGSPDVLLRLPASLTDRFSARCLLGPLNETETDGYIHGRLSAVGARDRFFSPDAIRTLHLAADGLPRRLNRLADLALLVAYADGLSHPNTRSVELASRELDSEYLAA